MPVKPPPVYRPNNTLPILTKMGPPAYKPQTIQQKPNQPAAPPGYKLNDTLPILPKMEPAVFRLQAMRPQFSHRAAPSVYRKNSSSNQTNTMTQPLGVPHRLLPVHPVAASPSRSASNSLQRKTVQACLYSKMPSASPPVYRPVVQRMQIQRASSHSLNLHIIPPQVDFRMAMSTGGLRNL